MAGKWICLVAVVSLLNEAAHAQVDCDTPPNLDNGSPDASSTLFGAVATYMCDEGYQLVTSVNNRTCLSSGNWSNEIIRCEAEVEVEVEEDDEGLEGGAIAGIIIAVIVVIIVVAVVSVVLAIFLWRRYQVRSLKSKVSYSTEDLRRDADKFETRRTDGTGENNGTGVTGETGQTDVTGQTGNTDGSTEAGNLENGVEMEQSNENLVVI